MYLSVEEVRERTSFEEISSASVTDAKLTGYIERAESWLHRATNRTFREEADPDIVADVRVAVGLLVEYIWYWDQPDIKETTMGPYESENRGSYSYKLKNLSTLEKANPGQETGIKELDNIIASLTLKSEPITGISFFSISGPSRVSDDGD